MLNNSILGIKINFNLRAAAGKNNENICWARYKNILRVEGSQLLVLCCESYSPLVECLHVGNIIERPELHPRTVPWPDLRLPSHQSAFRSPPCRLSSPPSGHSRQSDRRLGRPVGVI